MPTPAATAILEFGKLVHDEAKRPANERGPRKVDDAEQRLIEQLSTDTNPHLKLALLFNVSKAIDPMTLRILALVSYLHLYTNFRVASSDIAIAVADDEPSKIFTARQVITQLLYGNRGVAELHCGTVANTVANFGHKAFGRDIAYHK